MTPFDQFESNYQDMVLGFAMATVGEDEELVECFYSELAQAALKNLSELSRPSIDGKSWANGLLHAVRIKAAELRSLCSIPVSRTLH